MQIALHHAFQCAIRHVIGAGFIEAHRHLRVGHQRRAFGDVDDALIDILRLIELRRAY